MAAKVHSAALLGMDARIVEVEVDIQKGLHKFTIVGLPGKAVQESKDRVTSAIKNSNADFISRKITVNLAPADLPKSGPTYDLPIAVGILYASGQVDMDIDKALFAGELSLQGKTRGMNGVLSIVDGARKAGFEQVFLPIDNASEAALIEGIDIYPVKDLDQLIFYLHHGAGIEKYQRPKIKTVSQTKFAYDMSHIKGQNHAKRAMEIAAAGGHNVILSGTPGSGKTLLAKTLPSILPELTPEESLEVTRVYSIAGMVSNSDPLVRARPYRSPHHTLSEAALVGGGTMPRPGEISLAHRGVLFLDEFPEFSRAALESLRQPLEDEKIAISRVTGSLVFPASFTLVAAMNPCPCGWLGDTDKECTCTPNEVNKYQKRISGPILDRIDLQVNVQKVKYDKLLDSTHNEESSQDVRTRVQRARDLQQFRYRELAKVSNSELTQQEVQKYVILDDQSKTILKKAVEKMNLSARSYFRLLRVARTIADLAQIESVNANHVAEALSYRLVNDV